MNQCTQTQVERGPDVARRPGFTLIEMVVVVVIIAVLAGFLLPAVNRARHRAKVLDMDNTAETLANAIRSYHHEYSQWPMQDPSRGRTWTNNPTGLKNEVIFRLVADNNARRVPFWGKLEEVIDPFGGPYNVQIEVQQDFVDVWTTNMSRRVRR